MAFNIENLKNVPHLPGCYMWKDVNNNIIYIGKAKDLNKRMHQYFNKTHNLRISKLVQTIYGFDYIVVNNENEALILENNLIKKHQPQFNVLLKDGSNSYPYILITNEKHPRIRYTRIYQPEKGKFYGPFAANDTNAKKIYEYLNRIFPLRKCNILPQKKCPYFDMKQCLGPCIQKIDQSQYAKIKQEIDDLFNNKNKELLHSLKQKELMYAEQLDFEQADYYFKLQTSFKNLIQNQIVQLNEKIDADYIGYYVDEEAISINIFNYVDGKLISKNQVISLLYNDDVEASVLSYLIQYYSCISLPKVIYISLSQDNLSLLETVLNTSITKPLKGQKLDLLTQAIKNSHFYLEKNKFQLDYQNQDSISDELAKLLDIKRANYLEMIDNANLFLETNVSGLVVFKNGLPVKSMYRHYNLDLIEQKSDYHFMYEVVKRRYSRLIKNKDDLPDLLILDGGINQIRAAKIALSELNIDSIKVIGLVKNNKHQTEHILLDNNTTINLDHQSNLFLFLTKIQNEVHRFAINFYRNKRVKSKLTTILDEIEGIGPKTKDKILALFPNLYDLKKANQSMLEQVVSDKIASLIMQKIKETSS